MTEPEASSAAGALPHSALFVPADRLDFAEKALLVEADAICFDLEDGVSPARKRAARESLAESCQRARSAGKRVIVRVNSELEWIGDDIAALADETDTVLLAKSGGLAHVRLLQEALDRKFHGRAPTPAIMAAVEDPLALNAFRTAPGPVPSRLVGLFFGVEDMAVQLTCEPDAELIKSAFHDMTLAAAAINVAVFGYPASVSDFTDLAGFEKGVERGRDAGAVGGLCIHPSQVPILNRVFSPDATKIDWARRVVCAFEVANRDGVGAVSVDGRMIDRPVYERAVQILGKDP